MAKGLSAERAAVHDDPTLAGAHLYLGVMDLEGLHDAAASVSQFADFLATHPAASLIAEWAPTMKRGYALDGEPAPAAVVGAG
jgi:hypothetical protein